MQMMRQLYSDMRIRIAVEVGGRIVDTNARYVDGSRVTLMDVDFGRLLEDETRFQQLLNANPKSIEEVEQIIGDNPALRVDTQEKVSIRFN
jgi:DNA-directed RNA polymerase